MSNYHKMSVPTIPINAKNVSWHILITPKKNVYIYIIIYIVYTVNICSDVHPLRSLFSQMLDSKHPSHFNDFLGLTSASGKGRFKESIR